MQDGDVQAQYTRIQISLQSIVTIQDLPVLAIVRNYGSAAIMLAMRGRYVYATPLNRRISEVATWHTDIRPPGD